MKYILVLFMCIGLCVEGYRGGKGSRGSRGGRGGKGSKGGRGVENSKSLTHAKDYMGSVMQLPSVYHSCNAFFVTNDILVAPATCVLCDENCKFQVAVHTESVHEPTTFIKVENVTMHPNFVKTSFRGNPGYNIALIKLVQPASTANPLVISKQLVSKDGYVRSWSFNKKMTDFHLNTHIFEKVTHYICDEAEIKVKVDEICIQGFDSVELGKFNEGTPFVIDGVDMESKSSAMGFFGRGGTCSGPSKYHSFISIAYYYDWLNENINKLSQK